MTLKPTAYSLNVNRWRGGCGSEQCPRARRIVLARGRLPCNVLFVGEAPGASEDVLGQPFVGPAGKLLDQVIEQAFENWQVPGTVGSGYNSIRYAMTNLVGCLPRDREGNKAGEPEDEQVESCRPRLEEFIRLANPRLIVCVGKLAKDWLTPGYKHSVALPDGVKLVHITHPAAILRANVAWRGLEVQKCVVAVRNAMENL